MSISAGDQTPRTVSSKTSADDTLSPPKRSLQRYGSDEEINSRSQRPRTMLRSYSESFPDSRKSNIRHVVEQTNNVIVDLGFDGTVKWVSPSWTRIMGSLSKEIIGSPIQNIIISDKAVFDRAVASLRKDDSRSRIVKFMARLGPLSIYSRDEDGDDDEREDNGDAGNNQAQEDMTRQGSDPAGEFAKDTTDNNLKTEDDDDAEDRVTERNRCMMQGQGIMVFDRNTGEESHTMWMLRPFEGPEEITIDLPPLLVEFLGVGAEVLANYLTKLAESKDRDRHPSINPPDQVLCRICERLIDAWWFQKHSEFCIQEHRAEMEVQNTQDVLNDCRRAIVKVLDAFEQSGTQSSDPECKPIQPQYKGLPIGPPITPIMSETGSSGSLSNSIPSTSRDASRSRATSRAPRPSFGVRRPLSRIVELILDLCDTALEISLPTLKEFCTDSVNEFRTNSPQSDSRIGQVLQWQSPSSNTLQEEAGLAELSNDTEEAALAKVDAVRRHRRIIEYGERIRIESAVLIEECIAAAMAKADKVAAGDLSDSSSGTEEERPGDTNEDNQVHEEAPTLNVDQRATEVPSPSFSAQRARGTSRIFGPLPTRVAGIPDSASPYTGSRPSSAARSKHSPSPMGCPTPRSNRDSPALEKKRVTPQASRRTLVGEPEHLDLDHGSLTSALANVRLSDPSMSDGSHSRQSSSKRHSIKLSSFTSSPRREHSATTAQNPPISPGRTSKRRLSISDNLPSPVIPPESAPPTFRTHSSSTSHRSFSGHDRRHSSVASSDLAKSIPVSPHITAANNPPQKVAPPSIKDFAILKPISKGAFGSVFLAKKKSTGEYFAMKVLKKTDMIAKNQISNVKAERAIMMWQGDSDFVAKLYWTFASKDYLYLVMEYLNGGDCASLIKNLGGLPEDYAKKYIAEVVMGVEHLHERGIVHRDLKPDNLLIDYRGHLKLTDFGLSRMGLVGRQKRIRKNSGQVDAAPDLLRHELFHLHNFSGASSHSASFDIQHPEASSPQSTPSITPDMAGSFPAPSYFSLSHETLPMNQQQQQQQQQGSRRSLHQRSDSENSDTLSSIFRNSFSVYEDGNGSFSLPPPSRHSQHGYDAGLDLLPNEAASNDNLHLRNDDDESADFYPLHPTLTQSSSATGNHSVHSHMQPPPMALFDTEDHGRGFVGTPDYLAPETISGSGQDEMCDWWSLGVILFEFLFAYPPFNAQTPDEVFDNILHRRINWPPEDEIEQRASPAAVDLMNRLMTSDPLRRLGSNRDDLYQHGGEEVRAHSWFSDVNWATLLDEETNFIPCPENAEDTEYFDDRGATLQAFSEEMEDDDENNGNTSITENQDRPHDALSRAKSSLPPPLRSVVPLSIPAHVREPTRSRRLSEPVPTDDFGNFVFKNLPVLEKANKDVIQKLKLEALAQQRPTSSNTSNSSTSQSHEGSPLLPGAIKRRLSNNNKRSASPSNASHHTASASPSRHSQPSSPLLVQFSTGQHEHRKASGSEASASSSDNEEASNQSSSQLHVPRRRRSQHD